MRYYGDGVGHRGMSVRTAVSIDDVDMDSEWQDLAPDTVEIEREIPATAEHPEDLLRIVPEVADGAVDFVLQDELAMLNERAEPRRDDDEDDEVPEWEQEDEDGRWEGLESEEDADGLDGLVDEYTQVGYAAL